MKINFIIIMVIFLSLTSCKNDKKGEEVESVKRVGMVTGLKPDKMGYYKDLHKNVWFDVLKKLKECNIKNYSIYLQKIDDKYFLFSYFEYTGTDYEKDMKKMADDKTTQLWWKLTAPTQIPLPETAAKKQTWTNMEEVFHLK